MKFLAAPLMEAQDRRQWVQLELGVDELAVLFHLTDDLYRATSITCVYDAALNAIISGLQCQRASVLLLDEQGVMRFVASRGLSETYRKGAEGHSPWVPGEPDYEPVIINDIDASLVSDGLKGLVRSEGIAALAFIPLVADGKLLGKFMAYDDRVEAFTERKIKLALTIARQLGFTLQRLESEAARAAAEASLREGQEGLRREVSALQQLERLGRLVIEAQGVDALYRETLSAAMSLMRSDAASMQIYDRDRGALRLQASIGFHPDAAKHWEWVELASGSSCGAALSAGSRVVVRDIRACDFMAGTADFRAYEQCGLGSVQSTPLFARSGELVGMISTHWRAPYDPPESDLRFLDLLARQVADLIERAHTYASLQESEAHLRLATEGAQVGTWQWSIGSDRLSWSPFHRKLWGYQDDETPLTFEHWRSKVLLEDLQMVSDAVEACISGTERDLDVEYRISPDAFGELTWIRSMGRAKFSVQGAAISLQGISMDVTARKRAEEHRVLLVNELNHRVKNTLAAVQSIAMQTIRMTPDPNMVRELLDSRLIALSRAHDVLTAENWSGANVVDVVHRALEPFAFEGERIVRGGPGALLSAQQAVALSMALHELATNASKYGALSADAGRVFVTWALTVNDGAPVLRLDWKEQGGPTVSAPSRQGFGSRLIQRSLSRELNGGVDLTYDPEGVVCRMTIPLATNSQAVHQARAE